MDGLLFQSSEEPFDEAVRLRLGHEGVAWRGAPESDLLLDVFGHEVAAVVVAEREAAGSAGGEVAELLADGHGECLRGLEAGAALRDVRAEELGIPVRALAVRDHAFEPLPVARPEPDLNAFPHAPSLAGLRHQGTHQRRSNHWWSDRCCRFPTAA
jgi:hypothetical protein